MYIYLLQCFIHVNGPLSNKLNYKTLCSNTLSTHTHTLTHAHSVFPQTPDIFLLAWISCALDAAFACEISSSLVSSLSSDFFLFISRNNAVRIHQSIGGLTLFGPIKLSLSPAGCFRETSWSRSGELSRLLSGC